MGFRVAQIAGLARQMSFTPNDQRLKQIAAAEELLLQIDPVKGYPFDFVVFRITGYHPKRAVAGRIGEDGFAGQLLTGLALQHDLGVLIEEVSGGMNLLIDETEDTVLTTEQVVCQFNTSEKSVQRWRRRGLAARRFIFPDGKRRIGFLAASVKRFFAVYRDGMARAANFSPVSDEERQRIIRQARRLSAAGYWAAEIFRRVGIALNRSPLAIAQIVEAEPAILAAAPPPGQLECDCIAEAFDARASISNIAALVGRPRGAIYRILLERQLEKLSRIRVGFIDDPLYHQPDAARAISDIAASEDATHSAQPHELRMPRDVPAYLHDLCRFPLLSPARERALFLKMHFHRFLFTSLSRKLEAQQARWRQVALLQSHSDAAVRTKNQIVAANLRLVVSVARKHAQPGLGLMDLVSDGNIALMRAADTYDIHRGNRFSTYANLAVMKQLARTVSRRRRSIALPADVADERGGDRDELLGRHEKVRLLLANLPEREQVVLRAHFGITDERGRQPESLADIGRSLGITRQRVRQIEADAMERLRKAVRENSEC